MLLRKIREFISSNLDYVTIENTGREFLYFHMCEEFYKVQQKTPDTKLEDLENGMNVGKANTGLFLSIGINSIYILQSSQQAIIDILERDLRFFKAKNSNDIEDKLRIELLNKSFDKESIDIALEIRSAYLNGIEIRCRKGVKVSFFTIRYPEKEASRFLLDLYDRTEITKILENIEEIEGKTYILDNLVRKFKNPL